MSIEFFAGFSPGFAYFHILKWMIKILITAFLLASAVSFDTLASAFAYGTAKTRVPFLHILFLSFVGSIFFGLSLFLGYAISQVISPRITIIVSVTGLLSIGVFKIFQYFRRRCNPLQTSGRRISWGETIVLSVVLSVDSIAVGLGATIYNVSSSFCFAVIGFSLFTDVVFFLAGYRTGRRVVRKKATLDFSWLSGIVLIAIAAGKFFL